MKRTFTTSLFLIIFLMPVFSYTGEIINKFATGTDFPTGLCYDGASLWMADRKLDKIIQIDPETGEHTGSISSPAYWPMGITHDGENLWCIDIKGGIPLAENYNGIAYKLDDATGNILHQINLPCKKPTGLTWDGTYLWVADDAGNQIIQFSPEDGTTIKSFKAPAGNSMGLTFDGTYLWVSDRGNDEIYMMSPETGEVLLITDAPGDYSRGLAWDGEFLWNVDWQDKSIYKIIRKDDENMRKKDPKEYMVRYTHQSTNFGPGKLLTLDVHFALGSDRDNQELLSEPDYSVKPADFPEDQWNQKTAHFNFTNIQAGETREIVITNKVKLWDVRYFIFPDKVGSLDEIPENITSLYLRDNEKYKINHPVIEKAVKEAVGDEKNPYRMARQIYDYVMENMYYEMSGGWNTAPAVLERGNGSCSEYSFVYIAMCRAVGLPARYVGSVVVRGDDASMDDVFHRWAEIYLPNYGWVPVDPSGGDQDSPRAQADYFGHLANRFFITTQGGGNSESMEWTYNSNEFHTTEPKTHVVVEYFADWELLD
ncbi:MAG: transglutaminase domain-containing protein [Bacteroidota bacterium]